MTNQLLARFARITTALILFFVTAILPTMPSAQNGIRIAGPDLQ
jgi:hypothetical protein